MISYHKEMFAREHIQDMIEEADRQRLAQLTRSRPADRRSWRSTIAVATAIVRRLGRVAHAT